MRVVSELPRRVRRIDHAWIPLAAGTRLGARMWLPEDAEQDPVPAVLEYIPYRKGDGTAQRDEPRHAYVAGHGYAVLRVDLRGTGESDGLLHDEYLPREQQDALEVLRWIAAQRWCTGAVGMFGISWGGFNGLQVAAHRPPELKAVISLCSTDDRYADDVHYRGGAVLALEMLSWGASMLSFNAIAPDPEVAGAGWRDAWLERIDNVEPYEYEWLRHQRRDDYWRQGSVCEDFGAIACPVYAIGGWADGYSEAVLRLVAGLGPPSKGLIGPWSHAFPDDVEPGPAIGFLQECLRWWDTWLKGEDTGIAEEPILRVWMQEPVAPAARHRERPGRWVAERAWPSPEIREHRLALADGVLAAEPHPHDHRLEISTDLLCGLDGGVWCATAARPTPRSTSARTTGAPSASRPRPCPSGSSCSATPGSSSTSRATGRLLSWPRGSATWRPTALRCSSPAACST
jgi:putative CocE/NonD family hydrolase